MKNVLFIVGSMREKSFNKQLAKMAEEIIGDRANVTYLDYNNTPFMNQDIEFPPPEEIVRIRQAVSSADGIWFFTPEYNSSYPGLLKNLLDWLSRPLKPLDYEHGTAISGKKATISGAAGRSEACNSRAKLTELLTMMKLELTESQTGVSIGKEGFETDVLTLSDEKKECLKKQAYEFLASL